MKLAREHWLTALALIIWVLCFIVLDHYGTWLPFGVAGALLAALSIGMGSPPSLRLRPSASQVGIGVLCGLAMVVLTHIGYRVFVAALPGVEPATRTLFGLLDAVGLSTVARAALIVVIASCEEILFRGPLLRDASSAGQRAMPLSAKEVGRVCAYAALYAITTLPLGSPLLVLCALVCGIIWGTLTVLTGALAVPILTHALWDLGVLLAWPLATHR